jgi:phage N-6-adenine-methyltransferase
MNPDAIATKDPDQKWATPRWFMEAAGLSPVLDVCAEAWSSKAPRYYYERQDGLKQNWTEDAGGGLVWCNPPWGDIEPWLAKGVEEHEASIMFLIPARLNNQYMAQYLPFADTIVIPTPRLAFVDPETHQIGGSPAHHSMLVYLRPSPTPRVPRDAAAGGVPMVWQHIPKPKDAKR